MDPLVSAILVVALVVATVIGFAALLLDHAPVGLPLILAGAVGGG